MYISFEIPQTSVAEKVTFQGYAFKCILNTFSEVRCGDGNILKGSKLHGLSSLIILSSTSTWKSSHFHWNI